MNIVSFEHTLIMYIFVLICTMIGMNYASDELNECMDKIKELFGEHQFDRYEKRVIFITEHITLQEINEQFIQTKFIRHLFNAISEGTPKEVLNATKFCEKYDEQNKEACFDMLSTNGIERNATEEFIVEHVYYYLRIQENAGIPNYINDLVNHVSNSIVFNGANLFGVVDLQRFCRMIKCSNSIRKAYPDHCTEFDRPGFYLFYTYMYISVNHLKESFTKEFLKNLFTAISSEYYYNMIDEGGKQKIAHNPPDISSETFCDFFYSALRGDITTALAVTIQSYCTRIELKRENYDRETCIKEIKNLKLPVESFYGTAKKLYFDISENDLYKEKVLNDKDIIKYSTHYIRFITSLIFVESTKGTVKIETTPEVYCANNLEHYEDSLVKKKLLSFLK